MAENGGISVDEFTRLQNQLIELRTENYDIAEKYKKTRAENNTLHEKIESKEKELQRFSKIMKLPGLQAFSKNKGKRPYEEIVEENERLVRQMQRHEEDFNLQNKTLLEEVSRLSVERDEMENELKKMKDTRTRELDESDEMRRIKAENSVLYKKVQDYENKLRVGDVNGEGAVGNYSEDCGHDEMQTDSEDLEDGELGARKFIEQAVEEFLGEAASDKVKANPSDEDKERMEAFVAKLESFLSKRKSPRESNLRTNDIKVKLETAEAENQLLREQIRNERDKTGSEIESFKTEVEKLTEKTKKKQESFIQLQEEKESLHKEKSHLEEEWIRTKELLAKAQDTSAELEEQVEVLRKENENFTSEISKLQETLDQCSPEKVSELEVMARTRNEELTSLKSQLEEISSSNQDLMSEVQKLSKEKSKVDTEASQNLELANKRKKLLDELSVERQHELESHKKELEVVQNDNEEQKKHLESTLSDLEKARREVTLANDRHSELLKQFTSIEKKAGWLERTLKETEEQLDAERKTHQDEIDNREEEFKEKLAEVDAKHLEEVEALNGCKAEVERERDGNLLIIEKMNQKAKDKEVEFRISVKKNDQLLKDLKRQLKSERKRADQIQQRLQDFLSESKTRQTYDEIFKHDSSFSKGHRRQDSGSHLSTVSSGSGLDMNVDTDGNKTSTPLSGTPLSSGGDSVKLTNETVELISRVADLQLEKNILEEKVRFLEENSSVMADDIMRKTGIIQNYVRETKPEMHVDGTKKRNMTLKEKMKDSLSIGKHGKSEDMLREMNTKMQRLLEETLEKNIQLQKDIDHLTRELEMKSKVESE